MMLMVVWSQISSVVMLSSVESGHASTMEGIGATRGGSNSTVTALGGDTVEKDEPGAAGHTEGAP
jgi:hypothetical protein